MKNKLQSPNGNDKPKTFKVGDDNTSIAITSEDHYPIAGERIPQGAFVYFKDGKWYNTAPDEK